MGMRRQAVAFGGLIVFGLVGLLCAVLAAELNDAGIVMDEIVTETLTIGDVMTFTFLIVLFIGLIWYFIRKK